MFPILFVDTEAMNSSILLPFLFYPTPEKNILDMGVSGWLYTYSFSSDAPMQAGTSEVFWSIYLVCWCAW